MPHCQINKLRLPAAGSAKAEAHFPIWGHTVALCGAVFVDIQPSAALTAQGIEAEIPEALPKVKLRN
jgi:hypothetical protein